MWLDLLRELLLIELILLVFNEKLSFYCARKLKWMLIFAGKMNFHEKNTCYGKGISETKRNFTKTPIRRPYRGSHSQNWFFDRD